VVANGDIWDLEGANKVREECNVNGVMAARGLLANPALFSGYDQTPVEAIEKFVKLSCETGLIFGLFQRHVAYMMESQFKNKYDRIFFNNTVSHAGVIDYLVEEKGMKFS